MTKFIYKRKFYNNRFIRKYISLSMRVTHFFDGRKDKRICGCSLVKYVPSLYRETMGATGSESSCYWALDTIFKSVSFDESLIHGNAFEQDYNQYTDIFRSRPFETDAFYRFVDYLENNLTHKIRLIYWWDTQSGSHLENRAGWNMLKRDWIFTSHGLFMYRCPQRYTIWEYTL